MTITFGKMEPPDGNLMRMREVLGISIVCWFSLLYNDYRLLVIDEVTRSILNNLAAAMRYMFKLFIEIGWKTNIPVVCYTTSFCNTDDDDDDGDEDVEYKTSFLIFNEVSY